MSSSTRDIKASADRLAAFFARPPNDGGHTVECGASLVTFRGERAENQDRAFVALIPQYRSEQTLFVAAVLDGMGGMEEGGKVASIAASTFIQLLAPASEADLASRLETAILGANKAVWARMQGHGGTTLTAAAMTHGGECRVVHVGDSRLYCAGPTLRQVTSDDTPGGLLGIDDFGPFDSGLMQFIGIGDGMLHQAFDLSSDPRETLLLTSDGFHAVVDLNSIMSEAGQFGIGGALERSALGLSIDDNATAVTVNRRQVASELAGLRGGLSVISTRGHCVL